jgi:hypothetical protein
MKLYCAAVPTSFPGLSYEDEARHEKALVCSASILEEISSLEEILTSWKQLGNLLSLCREIAGARDILQKIENLKKQHEWNFNFDFAFLRRRSRKLNCRENFTNISSMESIYIINILIVD